MPTPFSVLSMAKKAWYFPYRCRKGSDFLLLRLDMIPNSPLSHSRISPMNSTHFQKCCWERFADILPSAGVKIKACNDYFALAYICPTGYAVIF